MATNELLKIENLNKEFQNFRLQNISFEIIPGTFHVFIGPNGSGKTTTIKTILGLFRKKSGDITYSGLEIMPKHFVGYVHEGSSINSRYKVSKYLKLHNNIINGEKSFSNWHIDLFRKLAIYELMEKKVSALSSGQLKRLTIAKALLGNPKLLIMDEPFANLDPDTIMDFFEHIQKLKGDGIAIFMSTHLLGEIEKFADYATVIKLGTIRFTGKLSEENKKNMYSFYKSIIDKREKP